MLLIFVSNGYFFRNHFATFLAKFRVLRQRLPQERDFVTHLVQNNFIEIICYAISDDSVRDVFDKIGIKNYSPSLVETGRNLLNLEIIGDIRQSRIDFDFSTLTGSNEVYLWEKYLLILQDRERESIEQNMLAEAIKLAKRGLNSANGTFSVEYPVPLSVQRLSSWGILVTPEGRVYRFRHEKLQDYIYAWDATERLAMPIDVAGEILPYKLPSVLKWMDDIYRSKGSSVRGQFLKEVLNVSR